MKGDYTLWITSEAGELLQSVEAGVTHAELTATLTRIIETESHEGLRGYQVETHRPDISALDWWHAQIAPKPRPVTVTRDDVVSVLIQHQLDDNEPTTEIGQLQATLMQQQVLDVLVLVKELGFDLVRREQS